MKVFTWSTDPSSQPHSCSWHNLRFVHIEKRKEIRHQLRRTVDKICNQQWVKTVLIAHKCTYDDSYIAEDITSQNRVRSDSFTVSVHNDVYNIPPPHPLKKTKYHSTSMLPNKFSTPPTIRQILDPRRLYIYQRSMSLVKIGQGHPYLTKKRLSFLKKEMFMQSL
jgi:hypothetical protein